MSVTGLASLTAEVPLAETIAFGEASVGVGVEGVVGAISMVGVVRSVTSASQLALAWDCRV